MWKKAAIVETVYTNKRINGEFVCFQKEKRSWSVIFKYTF